MNRSQSIERKRPGDPDGRPGDLTPPLPMPAHLTLEFLPPLDWTAYGPTAADDPRVVSACYDDITGRLQAALTACRPSTPSRCCWDAHGSPRGPHLG